MEKAEVRRAHRARRRSGGSGDPSGYLDGFRSLIDRLGVPGGAVIAGYLPGPGEPDLTGCLRWAHDHGHPVLVPRTLPSHSLEWVAWHPGVQLGPDRHGLSSPLGPAAQGGLLAVGVVLLPAIAADAWGTRLGQGAGYYDRALAGLPRWPSGPLRVAVLHPEEFLAGQLQRERHDEPVDAILTGASWRLAEGSDAS